MADTYSISLQGLQDAQLRFDRAARNIADGYSPSPASLPAADDSVELSTRRDNPVDYAREAVNIIEAKTATEANLKVIATKREVDQNTIDLIA